MKVIIASKLKINYSTDGKYRIAILQRSAPMLVRKIKNDKIVLTHILLGAAAFGCQLNAYTMSGARRLVGTDWLDCLIM